jgi:GNAT superfamily N-acetyltransferase
VTTAPNQIDDTIIVSPTLHLRVAGPEHLAEILAMSRDLYAKDGLVMSRSSEQALRNLLECPQWGRVFLAENPGQGGQIVGQVIVCLGYSIEMGGRDLLVEEIYVKPDHRGNGYGASMLGAVEDWARREGFASAFLEVLEGNHAERLYRKLGYGDRASVFLSKSLLQDR